MSEQAVCVRQLDHICAGGELNFVYDLDPIDNAVWTHTLPPATPR